MRRARKAAAGLKKLTPRPQRLLTSPLVRARQTAQILTDIAGWPAAEEAPELSPGEPALAVLDLLAKDRSKLTAVVGHQPGLGHLLAAVCSAAVVHSPSNEKERGRVRVVRRQARAGHPHSNGSRHRGCCALCADCFAALCADCFAALCADCTAALCADCTAAPCADCTADALVDCLAAPAVFAGRTPDPAVAYLRPHADRRQTWAGPAAA